MMQQESRGSARGLVLVFTGNGKGKTTAALGTVLRMAGYRQRCLVVQFIKERGKYGELLALERLEPEVEVFAMGRGFVGIAGDKLPFEEHVRAAQEALVFAREKMLTEEYRLVVLDEVFVALSLKLIPLAGLLEFLEVRPEKVSLILTGREAPPEVVERADTVTDMTEIKHAFQHGVPALRGVDF